MMKALYLGGSFVSVVNYSQLPRCLACAAGKPVSFIRIGPLVAEVLRLWMTSGTDGCGSKPCAHAEHQNRYQMEVDPAHYGAIGHAPWPDVTPCVSNLLQSMVDTGYTDTPTKMVMVRLVLLLLVKLPRWDPGSSTSSEA